MTNWTVKIPPITDEELSQAIAAGQRRQTTERGAAGVRYTSDRDAVEIELTDGAAVRLPRAMAEEFRDVPPADMAKVRFSPAGYGIKLDEHYIDISVHGLIAALATPGDAAASLGKLGGAAQSQAKHVSARANGAKGERSGKVRTGLRAPICDRVNISAVTERSGVGWRGPPA